MSKADESDFHIGSQGLDEGMLDFFPLEDLEAIYRTETGFIEDSDNLGDLGEDLRYILDKSEKKAREELSKIGVETDSYRAVYSPKIEGAEPVKGEKEIKVGRPGKCDRPYYLVTELSHEMLHQFIENEKGISNTEQKEVALEEGLCQVWNLYHTGLLTLEGEDRLTETREQYDENSIEERLDDMQNVYNQHMKEGYGDQISWVAYRLVSIFHEELDGEEDERMEELMDYTIESMKK